VGDYVVSLVVNDGTVSSAADSVTVSATVGLLVSPYYENGADWNDYVINNGTSIFNADDTEATGAETGSYSEAVIHGGEMRAVAVSGLSTCTEVIAYDSLGAFMWTCRPGDPVTVVSTGLADGVYLSDLIDFATIAWKQNTVYVDYQGELYGSTSPEQPWWDNPVNPVDTPGTLVEERAIYAVSSSLDGELVIADDKVALVTGPGVMIQGVTQEENVIQATGRSFLWIEGEMMGAVGSTGSSSVVYLSDVQYSVLHGVHASYSGTESGVRLDLSSNNLLKDVTARNNADFGVHLYYSDGVELDNLHLSDNQYHGIYLFQSNSNTMTGIKAYGNGDCGVRIRLSESNRVYSSRMADNGTRGLELYDSSGATVSGVTSYNNFYQGVGVTSGYDNVIVNVTSFNNGSSGISLASTSYNALIDLTLTNNRYGVELTDSSYNTVDGVIAANGTYRGLGAYASSYNTFSNIVSASNYGYAIVLQNSSSNRFTGTLKVDNNCIVAGTFTDPGIQNVSCNTTTPSDTVTESVGSIADSFVGKVSSDAMNTSDNDGWQEYSAITDWVNFESSYRGWGREGNPAYDFPDTSQSGIAGPTEGLRIWDWRLDENDEELLESLSVPGTSDTLTHTWSTGSVEFLRNSREIIDDGLGNDDGLCEDGEDCIFTPNIGSYQGHGTLLFDSSVGTVDLYHYVPNGL
jgi:parallel beta-helix repeat protein